MSKDITHSRVGAMCTDGDQAYVTMRLSTRLVVSTNDGETGVFARGTTVGLERAAMEARDSAQILFQLLNSN